MKKLVILALFVFLTAGLFASEWIQIDNEDWKIARIDTAQGIIIMDGAYEITKTKTDTTFEYLYGKNYYFWYKQNPHNRTLSLPKETVKKMKIKTYGKPDTLGINVKPEESIKVK